MKIIESIQNIIRYEGYISLVRRIVFAPLAIAVFILFVIVTALWSLIMIGVGNYYAARDCWDDIF